MLHGLVISRGRIDFITRVALALAIATPGIEAGAADAFPERPIRIVIPFAPGGDTDSITRMLAHELTESLGQPVVVDNRAGANGILATEIVAKSAAPDGHTLLMAATGLMVNPSLYAKLPYDALRDLVPISLIATGPHVLVVHPTVPAKSVKELIAHAKAHPDKLTYSSAGNGSSSHLAAAMLNVMANTRMTHVPYRGTSPAAVAVVSGEVSLTFLGVSVALPQVKSGQLRAIAVTGPKRSASAPSLPTVAESGLPGFESGQLFGILAPARTPKHIVRRLNSEITKAIRKREVSEKLAAQGAEVIASTPEQFGEFIARSTKMWAGVIKTANIRIQ